MEGGVEQSLQLGTALCGGPRGNLDCLPRLFGVRFDYIRSADDDRGTAMKQARILIVDDEAGAAEIIAMILNKRSDRYAATSATSGAEGVRLALEDKFDLILSDVRMGDVDGEAFLTKLKNLKIQTRFIFMTAAATDRADTVRLTKLGACDVLHKPITPQQLEFAIERALVMEGPLGFESGDNRNSNKDLRDRAELLDREARGLQKRTYELDKGENDLKLRVELLHRDEREFSKRVAELDKRANERKSELDKRENNLKARAAFIPLIFLGASILTTVLLYRLGLLSGTAPAYLLPLFLFILLSLPFDRIKTFVAKMKKTEGRATFK